MDKSHSWKELPISLGGATFARAIPNAVAFGPVFPGQDELAHEADEHYRIIDYKRLIELYASALIKLCEISTEKCNSDLLKENN